MIKKILITIVLIIIAIAAVVFIYRRAIIQYSAEKLIRSNLPSYIKFEKLNFDLTNNRIILSNLKVLNPPGFLSEYLLKINSISCKYRIKGVGIPEGLEISEVFIRRSDISIERLRDGRINLVEMEKFVQSFPTKETHPSALSLDKLAPSLGAGKPEPKEQGLKGGNKTGSDKKISDIIKLPHSFSIRDARIEFWDRLPYDKPHVIAVESVNGEVSISFDDNYSKILNLAFTLEGNLNGAGDEALKWVGSLNPAASKLTMSNRFEVSNLDILAFEPYYDAQSPLIFSRGRFSGDLVFDFDNGNIGSTNEIRLSGARFLVKRGYENAQFWETSVPELIKYFTSTSGDIIFDFKIKGDMANPQFYLGPISKRALTSMAIDKISSVVEQITKQKEGVGGTVDKAKDYIDLFKGLIKK